MKNVAVRTATYEFAHGHRPRGRGYWLFFFDGETDALRAWGYMRNVYYLNID